MDEKIWRDQLSPYVHATACSSDVAAAAWIQAVTDLRVTLNEKDYKSRKPRP